MNVASSTAPDTQHIRILDTLRGIAALSVFLAHFAQQFLHPSTLGWPGRVLELLGVWGVGVFFVLSGFVIHGGTLVAESRSGRMDWATYRRRRFLRIVPAYVAALVVCAIVSQYAESNMIAHATWPDFLTHLLFVSSFVPDHFENINAVLWTVIVECHFYCVYPLFRPTLARLGAPTFLVTVTLFCGLLFVVASALTPVGGARIMVQHTAPVLFWQWCLGTVLAEAYFRDRLSRLRRGLAATPWIPMSIAGAFLGTALPTSALQINFSRFVLPCFCFVLVGSLVFSRARDRRTAIGEHLGDISYSIYLWHPLALLVGLRVAGPHPAAAFACSIVLTLAAAEVSHRLIETPFNRLGRRQGHAAVAAAAT